MASGAAALVAGIIDRIEGRPTRTGRPPLPTIEVVETLRFFVREGVQWRELRAAAGRACGSTLRRRLDGWSATALLRRGPCRPGPDGTLGTRGRRLGRGGRQLRSVRQAGRQADEPQSDRPRQGRDR